MCTNIQNVQKRVKMCVNSVKYNLGKKEKKMRIVHEMFLKFL